jgi:splicing factor 3B subunit 1
MLKLLFTLGRQDSVQTTKRLASYTAPPDVYNDLINSDDESDPFAQRGNSRRIIDRESEYHARRLNRVLSPERHDPFAEGGETNGESRSYVEVIKQAELEREEYRLLQKVEEKKKEAKELAKEQPATQKKRRWDMATPVDAKPASDWSKADDEESTAGKTRWDETPRGSSDSSIETPRKRSRWDVTPLITAKKSRWDETPVVPNQLGATPVGNLGLVTPTPGHLVPMTPEGKVVMLVLVIAILQIF